jgi:hypothetical protein
MTRKPLSTTVENELQKAVKILAVKQERPLAALVEEAFIDLLKKHGESVPETGTD